MPGVNSSYTMTFPGLSLKCKERANEPSNGAYGQALRLMRLAQVGGSPYNIPSYAGFVPTWGLPNESSIVAGLNRTLRVYDDPTQAALLPTLDEVNADVARLLFIVQDDARQPRMWECKAINASYTTTFSFDDGQQKITIDRLRHLNDVPMVVPTPSDVVNRTSCYGYEGLCAHTGMAYVAIYQAFAKLLCGLAVNTASGEASFNTAIRSTILAQALTIPRYNSLGDNALGSEDQPMYFVDAGVSDHSISMKDALEQIMQNITLSLFSIPSLMYVYDSRCYEDG